MLEPPYSMIAKGLKAGEVVPFFGAAASAVFRPAGEPWSPGKPFLPFGAELATLLASAASFPADVTLRSAVLDILSVLGSIPGYSSVPDIEAALTPTLKKYLGGPPALALVASWAEHVQGHRRAVNRELRQCFAIESIPSSLHTKLAEIEQTQLFVTTNYDDLLEKALAPRQPHIIVDRGEKGLWVGVSGAALEPMAATGSELYDRLNDPKTGRPSRPILLKMHGSVDVTNAANDSYLITEEDYVDFLGRTSGSYIPPYVHGLMEGKDFLFLGYSLEDWNVRVIMRKLLKRVTNNDVRFWAIVRGRSDIEQRIWHAHKLNIYPMDLKLFSAELAKQL